MRLLNKRIQRLRASLLIKRDVLSLQLATAGRLLLEQMELQINLSPEQFASIASSVRAIFDSVRPELHHTLSVIARVQKE